MHVHARINVSVSELLVFVNHPAVDCIRSNSSSLVDRSIQVAAENDITSMHEAVDIFTATNLLDCPGHIESYGSNSHIGFVPYHEYHYKNASRV